MNPQRADEQGLFGGFVTWGGEFLPQDLILSVDSIRKWAFDQNLIWDIEAQLVSSERIQILERHFSSEDKLLLLIHLYKNDSENLSYIEYPYLPIKTLIEKKVEIEIVY